jgi:hypothetical protein
MLLVFTGSLTLNIYLEVQTGVSYYVTSFTGSLTLNIYLEVQTGVSYYVTSFYMKPYPEHLPGSSDW